MTTTSEPLRTCVGCRTCRPAAAMRRFRFEPGAEPRLSTDVALGGRGAWLCSDTLENCLSAAAASRAFDRAFRRRVDPALTQALMHRISLCDDGGRVRNRR